MTDHGSQDVDPTTEPTPTEAGERANGDSFSILSPDPTRKTVWEPTADCLKDLNLDQVIQRIVRGKESYDLRPYFLAPSHDASTVCYRQRIFQDLGDQAIADAVAAFAEGMREVRRHRLRAERARYTREAQAWHVGAVGCYVRTLGTFRADLQRGRPASEGLQRALAYITAHMAGEAFTRLAAAHASVRAGLDRVHYNVLFQGSKITVAPYDEEPDYAKKVAQTFERFRPSSTEPHPPAPFGSELNHIEAQILDLVAAVSPAPFAALAEFVETSTAFVDETLARFDREAQFYLAYLAYIDPVQSAGLPFSYPTVSTSSKRESVGDTFDLALADDLVRHGRSVVTNDLQIDDSERILVVTGPNNGGKTTFARTVGQLHYLAALGCPVPGRSSQLFLCDGIYTHFEREEAIETLAGKLQDELTRLKKTFDRATPASLLIMNEMFSSTTLQDALLLSKEIIHRTSDLDALAVCVTFLDEIGSLNHRTVSMVSQVDPGNPAIRTFKVVRHTADGRAYARSLAEKYGLTYQALKDRVLP